MIPNLGEVSRASQIAGTTALRWIAQLESHGLIKRESHRTDRRTTLLALAPKGREALDSYFLEILTKTP